VVLATAAVTAWSRIEDRSGVAAGCGLAAGSGVASESTFTARRHVSAAATLATAGLAWTCLVDVQPAATEVLAIETADRALAPLGHLDEAESTRTAGLAVGDEANGLYRAEAREELANPVLCGLVGEVSDVDPNRHL
jgi:hypothetical protein